MDRILLIDAGLFETRAACLENGELIDIWIERPEEISIVGDFFIGRVSKVMNGLNAVFVDLGDDKTGFLKVHNIDRKSENIGSLVHEGKKLLVQVIKDGIGEKGPEVSCFYSLHGTGVIYHPLGHSVTFSRQIRDSDKRDRIKDLIASSSLSGGFTIRTVAQSLTDAELRQDFQRLSYEWEELNKAQIQNAKPRPIGQPQTAVTRILGDHLRPDTKIVANNADTRNEAKQYCGSRWPQNPPVIELSNPQIPIFEAFQVEEAIEQAQLKQIDLTSGANFTIEQTEAMTVIDVNSASNISAPGLKSNALATNLEAAKAISRQIRLRNLSGIIIIDFIQMTGKSDVKSLCDKMKKRIADDPVSTRFAGMTELGLMQIIRKRSRRPLSNFLHQSCPFCAGTGYQDAIPTALSKLIRQLEAEKSHDLSSHIIVEAGEALATPLLGHKEKIESHLARRLTISLNSALPQTGYNIKWP